MRMFDCLSVCLARWLSQAWRYLWLRLQDQDSHGREVRKKSSCFRPGCRAALEVPPTGSANQFTIEFGYNEVGALCFHSCSARKRRVAGPVDQSVGSGHSCCPCRPALDQWCWGLTPVAACLTVYIESQRRGLDIQAITYTTSIMNLPVDITFTLRTVTWYAQLFRQADLER